MFCFWLCDFCLQQTDTGDELPQQKRKKKEMTLANLCLVLGLLVASAASCVLAVSAYRSLAGSPVPFAQIYLHCVIGVLLGIVLLKDSAVGAVVVAAALSYQFLQSIANPANTSNDDDVAGYLMGILIVLYLSYAYLLIFTARPLPSRRLYGQEQFVRDNKPQPIIR